MYFGSDAVFRRTIVITLLNSLIHLRIARWRQRRDSPAACRWVADSDRWSVMTLPLWSLGRQGTGSRSESSDQAFKTVGCSGSVKFNK